MRSFAWLVLFALLPSAQAQMVRIVLKDEQVEKNYAKYLTRIGATDCVVGEIKSGIKFNNGTFNYTGGDKPLNELWLADAQDPGTVPYVDHPKTGQREKNKKARVGVLGIPGNDLLAIQWIDRDRTLVGVSADYLRAMDEIAALTKERDSKPKTERAWFDLHGRMTGKMNQLALWLNGLGYGARAKELQKDLDKQRKTVAKSAANAREKASLASIKVVPTPQKLVDLAVSVTGGKYKFKVQESKHVRFTYIADLNDAEIASCLELSEHVIEGFLREMVDPYIDEQFVNHIPDGLIHEFYYGPEDPAIHGQMLTAYYGQEWGKNKADELKAEGADYYRKEAPWYLSYRKVVKEIDLPGYTIHEIGHSLMDLHYNQGARNDAQDWLREAVGYYVSLNYIGRNGLVCFSSNEEAYAKAKQEVGIKTPQNGVADVMNQIAIKIGPTLDVLAVKKLWQVTDADFAKSWSFYDYLVRKRGKPAQVWLRQTCTMAGDGKFSFVKDWRTLTETFEPVEAGQDVFAALEKSWRAYAEREQISALPAKK